MIVTCVYVNVKPEMISRFVTLTTENHNESVKEPGNLRFDLIQQADDPCRFNLKKLQPFIKPWNTISGGATQ